MKQSQAILPALMVCCLNACVVGPDYTPPDITLPEQFVSQNVFDQLADSSDAGAVDVTKALPQNWWEGYSDPILNQLVEEALQYNNDIASAAARLTAARAAVRLADSRDDLQTTFDVDTNAQQAFEFIDQTDSTSRTDIFGTFSGVLPLDVFGRTRRRVEAARAELEEASAELRGVILDVSADVTNQYLRMRGNQRQLTLLEQSVALQIQTLNIVESRYNAGLSPEFNLRQAESAVATLEADLPDLREALINARNNLATLTGQFPGAYQDLLEEEEAIPLYQGGIPRLIPLDMLTRRPDILEAEAQLKSAIADIGVAQAEWYPAFQLSQQISIGATEISSLPTIGSFIANIGGLMQQAVTDGGARRANVNIAKAAAEEALADYRQTLLDAVEEVEAILAAIQASLDEQKSFAKAVEASNRSYLQAETLYQQGLTDFLDVVDAQRVLASAQQQLARAKTDYVVEITNLFRAFGSPVNAS